MKFEILKKASIDLFLEPVDLKQTWYIPNVSQIVLLLDTQEECLKWTLEVDSLTGSSIQEEVLRRLSSKGKVVDSERS